MSDLSFLEKDEAVGKVRDMRSFTYLLRYTLPFKRQFILALSLMTTSATLTIFSSRLMGTFVEKGLNAGNAEWSWRYAAIILALEITAIVLIWFGRRHLAVAASNFILEVRKALFKHIHELPLSYYDRQPQGRVITRMTHDVEGMDDFFTSTLGRFIGSIIFFTLAFTGMLLTDWKLGLYLLAAIMPAFIFTYLTKNQNRDINRNMSRSNSSCNARLAEYVNGIQVIRSFGLEDFTKKNYDRIVSDHLKNQLNANFFYCWTRPFTSLLCMLPLLTLIFFGGRQVMAGTLGLGIFVAFVRYCERFANPVEAVTREINVIQQAFTSAERVTTFLNAVTEKEELGQDGEHITRKLQGELQFDHVSMAYDKKTLVLDDISFHIRAGEKIGLAGTTGSGKTSTLSLLARLYEFQSGEIKIDGRSIREYNRESLRTQLGFVSQDVIIFRGTLRDNLTCEEQISDHKILEAMKKTGLAQVLLNNNLTLESEILDGGSNLSVGERQLLALTRVLLRDPSILILDEATANIDPQYEKIIHQAVNEVMEGRTCLIIAHRLDTLKDCDRILVFREGKIVEEGSHLEMMDRRGYFFQLQMTSVVAPESAVTPA